LAGNESIRDKCLSGSTPDPQNPEKYRRFGEFTVLSTAKSPDEATPRSTLGDLTVSRTVNPEKRLGLVTFWGFGVESGARRFSYSESFPQEVDTLLYLY
jgi:hypothetical protein